MTDQAPYDLRGRKRSNRYVAGGRLRPLRAVLLINQFWHLAVHWRTGRTIGSGGRWILYRSGYQERRRAEIMARLRALRYAKSGTSLIP